MREGALSTASWHSGPLTSMRSSWGTRISGSRAPSEVHAHPRTLGGLGAGGGLLSLLHPCSSARALGWGSAPRRLGSVLMGCLATGPQGTGLDQRGRAGPEGRAGPQGTRRHRARGQTDTQLAHLQSSAHLLLLRVTSACIGSARGSLSVEQPGIDSLLKVREAPLEP